MTSRYLRDNQSLTSASLGEERLISGGHRKLKEARPTYSVKRWPRKRHDQLAAPYRLQNQISMLRSWKGSGWTHCGCKPRLAIRVTSLNVYRTVLLTTVRSILRRKKCIGSDGYEFRRIVGQARTKDFRRLKVLPHGYALPRMSAQDGIWPINSFDPLQQFYAARITRPLVHPQFTASRTNIESSGGPKVLIRSSGHLILRD